MKFNLIWKTIKSFNELKLVIGWLIGTVCGIFLTNFVNDLLLENKRKNYHEQLVICKEEVKLKKVKELRNNAYVAIKNFQRQLAQKHDMEALNILKKLSECESAKANFNLGQVYCTGKFGLVKNVDKGREYFKRALVKDPSLGILLLKEKVC